MRSEQKHQIVVISKKDCHICEHAVDTLLSMRGISQFDLTILSIDDDAKLLSEYLIKVPVIRLDGIDVLEAEDIARREDCRAKLQELVSSLG